MAAGSLKIVTDGLSGSDLSIAHRKIDFHQERRKFNRLSNNGENFGRKTMNQSSSDFQRQGPEPNRKKRDRSEGLEMDHELSFRITFRKIGAGLANLGNTCFLNSVLQCLTYTEPLAAYLQSGKHQTSCRTAGFCALCAIQKHVSRALQSTGRILAPKEIVSNLRYLHQMWRILMGRAIFQTMVDAFVRLDDVIFGGWQFTLSSTVLAILILVSISRSFRNSRQEDSHEYMVNLLESMHKCCIPSGVPSESPIAYDKSLVHKIFGGRLRSQVKCTQCSFSSNKFDPFIDLSLEIVKADSLSKALGHFTAKEQLDGGERQYQCQRCKQKVRADKQLTIHKAPYVLSIHLKRFSSYLVGKKIDKKIHFGPTLDLKPFVTDPYDVDLKYTLYGVLVHAGWSTHSGHYYCFVRTSSGMWYSLDDNQVVQVSERKVLEQKAYMLFYYRNKRDFGSKNSADQGENITRNVTGRTTYCSPKQELKQSIQTEQIDRRLNNKESSVAVAQRDSCSAALLPRTSVIDCPGEVVSRLTTAEHSVSNKDPRLGIPSTLPPLMDSWKDFSVKRREEGDSMAHQDSCAVGSLKRQSVMNTSSDKKFREDTVAGAANDLMNSGAKMPDCKAYSSTEKVLDNLIAISPNCDSLQKSHEVTSMKEDSLKNDQKALAFGASMSTNGKILPLLSSSRIHRENCYGIKDVVLAKLPGPPKAKSVSIQENALAGKPIKQSKLKIPNFPVIKMQLSSKILIGKSSHTHRKKHKRNKKGISESRHVDSNNLMNLNGMPSDLRMSSSKPFVSTTTSQRKRKEPLSKKKQKSEINSLESNRNGEFLTTVTHKKFAKGVNKNFAVIAEQSPKSCKTASAGNQRDDIGPSNSKDISKELMQNDLIGMLHGGLAETTIASWDETECSSLIMKDTSRADSAIGYVADEWDKEYDRGKRKKMRSFKNDFSGRNPFQEIAIMDTKAKIARMDQYNSGNRPVRIQ